jgi:hypothetical protein
VTLAEVEELGLMGIFNPLIYEERGLVPVFPKQDDNLKLVKEMLDYLDKGTSFSLNNAYATKKNMFKILGGMFSEDLRIFD